MNVKHDKYEEIILIFVLFVHKIALDVHNWVNKFVPASQTLKFYVVLDLLYRHINLFHNSIRGPYLNLRQTFFPKKDVFVQKQPIYIFFV